MIALPLLESVTVGSATPLTRMRACGVAGPVTFQVYPPSLAVLGTSGVHKAPPLRDTWSYVPLVVALSISELHEPRRIIGPDWDESDVDAHEEDTGIEHVLSGRRIRQAGAGGHLRDDGNESGGADPDAELGKEPGQDRHR